MNGTPSVTHAQNITDSSVTGPLVRWLRPVKATQTQRFMTERYVAPNVQIRDITAFEYVMVILVAISLGGVSGVARFFFFLAPGASNHNGHP